MRTSEQVDKIAPAMTLAQAEMKPALKKSENPHFKSKYADLAHVWDACQGPLTSHGLHVCQDLTTAESGGIAVVTRIMHDSGQWYEYGPLVVPLSKPDAQGVGSASSYARRYSLSAAVGVVTEDDDGEAASDPSKSKPQRDEARSVPRDAPKASGIVKDQDGVELTIFDNVEEYVPTDRDRVLAHIKELADSLGLSPEARQALAMTHVGSKSIAKAGFDKLKELEASLVLQCERAGR